MPDPTTLSSSEHVQLLYRHLLGREADADGLRHFAGLLEHGADLRAIVESILGSEEYQARQRPRAVPPLPPPDRPIVIVDVGARALDDETHVYAPLLALPWRCIGFEPQRHRIAEREAREPDPRLVLHDTLIGDGGAATFHVANEDGSSSLLELNTEFVADFATMNRLKTVETRQCETRTLDDVLRDEPYVDFLKLDIQGYEGRALAGAAEVLQRTNVVHCEVMFAPMYRGCALFSDIEALLRAAGFSFIDFNHLNRSEYVAVPIRTGQRERLIWGDAVFFRDRPKTRSDCLAQSAIASLVYGKYGLAQTVRPGLCPGPAGAADPRPHSLR